MGEEGDDQLNLEITEYLLSILEIQDRSSHIKSYMRYCIQEPSLMDENQSFPNVLDHIEIFYAAAIHTPWNQCSPEHSLGNVRVRDNKHVSMALKRIFVDHFH